MAPRFVVLDEFHTAKDGSTKVYKALNQMRKRAPVGHGFKLAALSATPITVSLSKSLRSVLSLIVPRAADLATFLAAAQTIDTATRAAPSWLGGQDVERDGAKDICRHLLLRAFVWPRWRLGWRLDAAREVADMYCTHSPRQLGVLEHRTTSFRVADNNGLSKPYSASPDTALPPWLHAAVPEAGLTVQCGIRRRLLSTYLCPQLCLPPSSPLPSFCPRHGLHPCRCSVRRQRET